MVGVKTPEWHCICRMFSVCVCAHSSVYRLHIDISLALLEFYCFPTPSFTKMGSVTLEWVSVWILNSDVCSCKVLECSLSVFSTFSLASVSQTQIYQLEDANSELKKSLIDLQQTHEASIDRLAEKCKEREEESVKQREKLEKHFDDYIKELELRVQVCKKFVC